MKKRPDPESFEDLESSLTALYHTPQPDREFTDKLEHRLRLLGPVEPENLPRRRRIGNFFTSLGPSLAWGVLAVVLVFGLIWSINNLLPSALPVALQGESPTPQPTATPLPTPAAQPASTVSRLSLSSSHQEIRERLTRPAWTTVWLQGQASQELETGSSQKMFVQAWLGQDGSGKSISTNWLSGQEAFSLDISPDWVWASSGNVWKLDVQAGKTEMIQNSGDWALHPLERVNPIMEMIFLPRELAILGSDVNPVEETEIAGRQALVVEWGGSRLWADAETGLVLKRQSLQEGGSQPEVSLDEVVYGVEVPKPQFTPDGLEVANFVPVPSPEGAESISGQAEVIAEEATIKVKSDADVVNVRSGPSTSEYPVIGTLKAGETAQATGRTAEGDWIQIEYPQSPDGTGWIFARYVDLSGNVAAVASPPTPTPLPLSNNEGDPVRLAKSERGPYRTDSSGALYFMLARFQDGYSYELFEVDLTCLFSGPSCKTFSVPGFPPQGFSPHSSLHWAPDGKKAVLLDGNNNQLLLYRPRTGEWQSIAYQLYISGGPILWSPDGTYLAARTQSDDSQANLITVIPADGEQAEPSWRTYADELGGEQTPMGWINNKTLLFMRSWTPPKGGQGKAEPPRLYKLNVLSGELDELSMKLGWAGLTSFPAISPDRSSLVLYMEKDGLSGLWVANLNTGETVYLGVNGDFPTWSSDGEWIAFETMEFGKATLYRIRPDGSGLQQLFQWGGSFWFGWSPDDTHLIVEAYPPEGSSDKATAMYLVSVSDSRVRRILMEGAGESDELRYPSFQPAAGR